MATYQVKGPDGKVFKLEGPEGASDADIQNAAAYHYNQMHAAPAPAEAAPPAKGTLDTPEVAKPPEEGYWSQVYHSLPFTGEDKTGEYRSDQYRRKRLKDLKENHGFLDKTQDMLSSGLMGIEGNLADLKAVVTGSEKDKADARQRNADTKTEVAGATKWEDVKRNPLNAVPYAYEMGIQSAPSMALSATRVGTLLNAATNTASIARARAEANGKQDVSGWDMLLAAPAGLASAVLDKYGLEHVLEASGKTVMTRMMKAAAAEGGTEAAQSAIEYTGGSLGTKTGWDLAEMGEQALQGGVAGVGIAGGMRGVHEAGAKVLGKDLSASDEEAPPAADEAAAPPSEPGAPPPADIRGQVYNDLVAQHMAAGMSDEAAMQLAGSQVAAEVRRRAQQPDTGGDSAGVSPDAGADVTGGPVTEGAAPDTGGVDDTARVAGAAPADEDVVNAPLTKHEAGLRINEAFKDPAFNFGVDELTPVQHAAATAAILDNPDLDPHNAIVFTLHREAFERASAANPANKPAQPVAPTTPPVQADLPPKPPKKPKEAAPPPPQEAPPPAAAAPAPPIQEQNELLGSAPEPSKSPLQSPSVDAAPTTTVEEATSLNQEGEGLQPEDIAAAATEAAVAQPEAAPAEEEAAPAYAPVAEGKNKKERTARAKAILDDFVGKNAEQGLPPLPGNLSKVGAGFWADNPTLDVDTVVAQTLAKLQPQAAPAVAPTQRSPAMIEDEIAALEQDRDLQKDLGNNTRATQINSQLFKLKAELAAQGASVETAPKEPAAKSPAAKKKAAAKEAAPAAMSEQEIEQALEDYAGTLDDSMSEEEMHAALDAKQAELEGKTAPAPVQEDRVEKVPAKQRAKKAAKPPSERQSKALAEELAAQKQNAARAEEAQAKRDKEAQAKKENDELAAKKVADQIVADAEKAKAAREANKNVVVERRSPRQRRAEAADKARKAEDEAREERRLANKKAMEERHKDTPDSEFKDYVAAVIDYADSGKPMIFDASTTIPMEAVKRGFVERGPNEVAYPTEKGRALVAGKRAKLGLKAQAMVTGAAPAAAGLKPRRGGYPVKYNEDGISASPSIDPRIVSVLSKWKKMLGLETDIHISTIDDMLAIRDRLDGVHKALDVTNVQSATGWSVPMGPGQFGLLITPSKSVHMTLEILAHELGHMHEAEVFKNASPKMRDAIVRDFMAWRKGQRGKTFREHIPGLRAFKSAQATRATSDTWNAPQIDKELYWRSFSEWYADQVARWATSDAKPVGVVQEFFARLGNALLRFYKTLRGQGYLPTTTFSKYMKAVTTDLDLMPESYADYTNGMLFNEVWDARNEDSISDADFRRLIDASQKASDPDVFMKELAEAVVAHSAPKRPARPRVQLMRPQAMALAPRRGGATPAQHAADAVATLEEKLARSRNPGNMAQNVSDIMELRRSGLGRFLRYIGAVIDTKGRLSRKLLYMLTTSDVVRLGQRAYKLMGDHMSAAYTLMKESRTARDKDMTYIKNHAYRWQKFNAKFREGGKLLSDLMNASTLHDIDVRLAPTAAAFIAQDARLAQIHADPNMGAAAKRNAVAKRTALINKVYDIKTELAKTENGGAEGQRIYHLTAESYKQHFDRMEQASIAAVNATGMSAARKAATVQRIQDMYDQARNIGIYFPLGRHGDFWFRMGTGPNREYQQFETAAERDVYMRERYDEHIANHPNDTRSYAQFVGDGDIVSGDNSETIRKDLITDNPTSVLGGLLTDLESGAITPDIAAIKDAVTDLFLRTLPQSQQASAMHKREGVTGFTANTLKTYVSSQSASASRLSRLGYGSQIRNELGMGYAVIEDHPKKARWMPYMDHMSSIVADYLAPTKGHPMAEMLSSGANRLTFMYMLSSVKTAIVQPLQLSTVGISALTRDHGPRAFGLALRYMSGFHNKFGTVKYDEDGNMLTRFGQPSMGDSSYIRNHGDPAMRRVLKAAWNDGNERGLFSHNFTGDVTGRSDLDHGIYDDTPLGGIVNGLTKFNKFMTGAMYHSERMSREVMFMSSFELQYKKLRKQGVSVADAQQQAGQYAADLTTESLFDYERDAKPMAARGPLGRVALQFTAFPMNMASMLIRNGANMVSKGKTVRERRDAAIMLFGTLGTTFLFSGVTGLPLYSTFMGLADWARELFRDSLEDEDEKNAKQYDESNPLAYKNTDLWFREWYLPKFLGANQRPLDYRDMSKEDIAKAEKEQLLQRSVEMGPISALTDLNLGSSMSLDNMFFREDGNSANDMESMLSDFFFQHTFGPTAGLIKQVSDGVKFLLNGDGERAAEKLIPYKMLTQPLVAARLAKEGYTTAKGDVVRPKEFYDMGALIAQSAGISSTSVGESQKANMLMGSVLRDVQGTKTAVIEQYKRAYLKLNDDPENLQAQAQFQKADDAVNDYNMDNGLINPLTGDTLASAVKGEAEAKEKSYQGLRTRDEEYYQVRERGGAEAR